MKKRWTQFALLLALLPAWAFAFEWNMPRGVTPLSREIYDLHMVIFWICCAIGVVVFSVMIYALIFHRKSRGFKPAEFHEHTVLEIVWAIIPFCILVVMAVPATRVLMDMDDTSDADLTIKITGYQWKWQYDYLDQGIRFFSVLSTPYEQIQNRQLQKNPWYLLEVTNEVVVPVNKKIRFLVTANDVIHSWWVPALGIKRDAIPGFIYESWAKIEEPGIYRGQCAELCGVNHAYMPIVVKAVSDAEFQQWVNAKKAAVQQAASPLATATPAEAKTLLMEKGKQVYEQICAACHQADGKGQAPLFPALKASSIAVGQPISRHIDLILKGVSGSAMQAYAEQLSDEEIASVVTYERNAWGNNTGDVVMPADVAKQRESK